MCFISWSKLTTFFATSSLVLSLKKGSYPFSIKKMKRG
ncbi:hypothetical protein POREN0001_0113 [Porphyromonas endodontalis ATCC 35406]|uniref:Uncharacterized protein n=1 Tax=Porphyromonas endodontalis (strain ATCC 35406 / DSM 24491 / JCM 8526 / CCUG 16442 / BCRC 14492 / NCTC 13058 / HG 370) TaxID=553175 RepID=C3JCG8_POREA|nr:hypothetical protein POREN0001_0113 [Porphyromonas endodontalis ATCC 35406]